MMCSRRGLEGSEGGAMDGNKDIKPLRGGRNGSNDENKKQMRDNDADDNPREFGSADGTAGNKGKCTVPVLATKVAVIDKKHDVRGEVHEPQGTRRRRIRSNVSDGGSSFAENSSDNRSDSSVARSSGSRSRSRKNNRNPSNASQSEKRCTLYVSNISLDVEESEFKRLFDPFGPLEDCRIINNPITKESRGFGFVSFTDEDRCYEALRKLDGHHLAGKRIRIEKAKRSRPYDPTPGHYYGPIGASAKYASRGRMRPGYYRYRSPPSRYMSSTNSYRHYSRYGGYSTSERSRRYAVSPEEYSSCRYSRSPKRVGNRPDRRHNSPRSLHLYRSRSPHMCRISRSPRMDESSRSSKSSPPHQLTRGSSSPPRSSYIGRHGRLPPESHKSSSRHRRSSDSPNVGYRHTSRGFSPDSPAGRFKTHNSYSRNALMVNDKVNGRNRSVDEVAEQKDLYLQRKFKK